MQSENKILDDISKLASNAVGAVHSLKGEAEQNFRAWLDRQLAQMDLVSREEFDVVRLMAEKARLENDALSAELAEIKAVLVAMSKTGDDDAKSCCGGKED